MQAWFVSGTSPGFVFGTGPRSDAGDLALHDFIGVAAYAARGPTSCACNYTLGVGEGGDFDVSPPVMAILARPGAVRVARTYVEAIQTRASVVDSVRFRPTCQIGTT